MTELEGFAAYVGCVFGSCSMKVEASVNYSASCDIDRSEHNSRFNPARSAGDSVGIARYFVFLDNGPSHWGRHG